MPLHALVKTMSGEEAERAVRRMTGQEQSEPAAAANKAPEAPAAETPAVSQAVTPDAAGLSEEAAVPVESSGGIDTDKVAAMKLQIDEIMEKSSPDQRKLLQTMQEQVNETVQRMLGPRKQKNESAGI